MTMVTLVTKTMIIVSRKRWKKKIQFSYIKYGLYLVEYVF